MNGRIFPDSANIFQDQARVLFEYYQKAAERIVAEEMRIEGLISSAENERDRIQRQIDGLKPRLIGALAGAGVLVLLYFVIGWLGPILAVGAAGFGITVKSKGGALNTKKAETEASIEALRNEHKQIRRDYKVHKLGVAYIPVALRIPFEDKSFVIDLTESTSQQSFRLSTVSKADLFASTVSELENLLREAPAVESSREMEEVATDRFSRSIQKVNYYDYTGALDRTLRTAAFCLEDLDTKSVELPTIPPHSPTAAWLEAFSATDPGNAPVFEPFPVSRFAAQLETFTSLNEMKKSLERDSTQFEDVLRHLMLTMAQAVQTISRMKVASTGRLVEESNRLMFTILKAPYNHYSPRLEADEIERIRMESFNYEDSVDSYRPFQLKASSRVHYDPLTGNWVGEDGGKTRAPFGMNQIQEEIIAPIVQNLMAETRLERLTIYNNIKDQKLNYGNQWHQNTEDFYGRNRAESGDLINLMRSTFSEFVSGFNALSALEKTEKNMTASGSLADAVTHSETDASETVAGYEMKAQEFRAAQEEFEGYMERVKEEIERRSRKYGFIEYYDASLRDAGAKAFAEAAGDAHNLTDRRKALLAVNPYYATASELPPAPSVEPLAYDNLSLDLEDLARRALGTIDRASVPPAAENALAAASGA